VDGLDFAIDRRAEVPIGVQLAWALRTRIQNGSLVSGQRLPGLRDLAQALKINANTVRAVYQRLEHEGMIESQQGSGTYVAPTARRRSAAGAIAASAAQEARQTGIDPREVAAALYVEPERTPPPEQAAERRRALRVQIATLEQLVVRLETDHPELVQAARAVASPDRALPDRGPRLLDAEELEQTQAHLIRRLAALQAALDERAVPPAAPARTVAKRPAAVAEQPAAEQAAEAETETATAPKLAARRRRPPRPAPA